MWTIQCRRIRTGENQIKGCIDLASSHERSDLRAGFTRHLRPVAMEWGWTWVGVFGLLATVGVALLVFRLQKKTHDEWNDSDKRWKTDLDAGVSELRGEVATLGELIRQLAEQKAAAQEERIVADSEPETGEDGRTTTPSVPRRLDDYVRDLRSLNVPLDLGNLTWKKKVRCDGDQRGNLGWFVDDGGDNRYFIHRGRTTTVRPAIPGPMLDAWRQETGRQPCEIELDYQTGAGRGNHSWFLRAYDGTTWRISSGGQGKKTPTVTVLE